MDIENKVYFSQGNIYFNHRDHLYYFGEDAFSSITISDYDIFPIDKWLYQSLDDGSEAALAFVERDEKMGVMTLYKGGYGGNLYSSNMFPLLYDEMLLNGSFDGSGIGYVAVRINKYWGVLRVEGVGLPQEKRSKSGEKCIMIIPCMYRRKEEAIEHIDDDDHPDYGWRDPFEDESCHLEKLKIGTFYEYEAGNEECSFPICGDVIYNNGVTAILRVTNMYAECEHLTLNFDEVVRFFPDFTDSEHTKRTCYLCLDVDMEWISYYHDINTYQIITPDTDPDDLFPDYEDDSDGESLPDEGSNII